MMALNPDFLPTMKEHFPVDAPVMVACKAGVRSANAAILLEREGYQTVLEVGPGWSGGPDENGMYAPGWATCGFPANTGDGGKRSFESLRVEQTTSRLPYSPTLKMNPVAEKCPASHPTL